MRCHRDLIMILIDFQEVSMILSYTAGPEDTGKKLFSVLHYRLRISTGQIKRLKYQTKMLVNGQAVHTNYVVAPGDRIELP